MMAGENEPEDDVLELGEEDLAEQPEQVTDTQPAAQAQDDIEIPTFDDGTEDQPDDTPAIRHMRTKLREQSIELKQFKDAAKPQPEIVVGPEPDIEDDEFNWDKEKWREAWDAWKERKTQAEAQQGAQAEQQRKASEQWKATLTTYATKRAAYPPDVMNEAEAICAAALTDEQRSAILIYAKEPAKFFLAVSRSEGKLGAISKIADLGQFIAETARMEGEIRMTKRKPTAEPDTPQRGSASLSQGAADKKLEQLEKDARRSGDRSKLVAYKAELNRKAA